jgi:hypothetical protein
MSTNNPDLAIPFHKSTAPAKVILAHLKKKKMTNTGGCRAFYTPEEWKERGEQYGLNAELIVVHDGGDLAPFFNWDYEMRQLSDSMDKALEKAGYYAEQCTCWYAAIYKKPSAEDNAAWHAAIHKNQNTTNQPSL